MTNKIDLSKFKVIEENLKLKKRVNQIINNEINDIPEDKKPIIRSILNNLQIKNDLRINNLIRKFKEKQNNLDIEKANKIISDFKKINDKIVKYDNEEIQKLNNNNIAEKFSILKENLADTSIALLEKEILNEVKRESIPEESRIEDLDKLLYDFITLKDKIKAINEILETSSNSNKKESTINKESTLNKESYKKKYMKKNYYYLYKKYKHKYLNLKNNLK